ncbi:MAG TPA: SRPBCC domain-containing protein, partial [Longimicrobium sp.]|nr:SRPBCC domain-containing protein [Longimicrobium sp.]
MPVTSVSSDADALTLTVIGDYPVPVERLWNAYEDPRQLERFWGPETWPATFTRHDMEVGGRSEYYMTGPDGT